MIKRTNEPGKGLLSGIGGHIEDGESPEECMRREWEEETGFSIPADAKLFEITTILIMGEHIMDSPEVAWDGMIPYCLRLMQKGGK